MLRRFSDKPVRRAVGLMSGTSVDGIDAALVEIRGTEQELSVELCAFENIPYPPQVRERIFELFDTKTATVDKVGYMNFLLGELFADAALAVIQKSGLEPADVEVIGSHGQTIFHSPVPNCQDGYPIGYTVQIGEGAVISARTGVPCVSDFRVADMAVGGQGAPLVPFTEYLLYRKADKTVLLQNIGGIGNITVIPAGCDSSQVFAFDTGPGNMIIDGLVNRLYGGKRKMDLDGMLARQGTVNPDLLNLLQKESYFSLPLPKSTGRELFGAQLVEQIVAYIRQTAMTNEDAVATVTYLTAWSIADAYKRYIQEKYQADYLVIGGGGSYNPALVQWISEAMAAYHVPVVTQEQLGNSSDAKEAIAFAILADCTVAGRVNSLPNVTGASKASIMGKISL
jgi:Predicted molecular chaperone distantly related to HSP70-fold metalloproteases